MDTYKAETGEGERERYQEGRKRRERREEFKAGQRIQEKVGGSGRAEQRCKHGGGCRGPDSSRRLTRRFTRREAL